MTHDERDQLVAQVIAQVPVPEHGPEFWSRLDDQLGGEVIELRPAVVTRRHPARWIAASAAMAAVVVAVAVGVSTDRRRQPVTVGPSPTTSTTPAPTTTALAPTSPPGAVSAVMHLFDALAQGDVRSAANLVGPRSEAYLTAQSGSVDAFLREAQEGLGAWATSPDRTFRTIEIRPGDVVVAVSGTVTVGGEVSHRADAFPVRYAESAKAWFVEGWAFDPATGGRLELLSQPSELRTGLRMGSEANGTAWLAVDGGPTTQTAVTNGIASWTFPRPLPQGDHFFVVALENDSTFAAIALTRSVGP